MPAHKVFDPNWGSGSGSKSGDFRGQIPEISGFGTFEELGSTGIILKSSDS